jgi:hypothetical protein
MSHFYYYTLLILDLKIFHLKAKKMKKKYIANYIIIEDEIKEKDIVLYKNLLLRVEEFTHDDTVSLVNLDGSESEFTEVHGKLFFNSAKKVKLFPFYEETETDWKTKVEFYRQETSNLRKYIIEKRIGKPNQSIFQASIDEMKKLQNQLEKYKISLMFAAGCIHDIAENTKETKTKNQLENVLTNIENLF